MATDRLFAVPHSLYVETVTYADQAGELLGIYTRTSIRLLGHASCMGFTVPGTQLVVGDEHIDLPQLTSSRANPCEPYHVLAIPNMSDWESEELAHAAKRVRVSEAERARRALRFRNFISSHGIFHEPRFRHKGEYHTAIHI